MKRGVRWLTSASKHGVKREDAVYAIDNAIRADANFPATSPARIGVVVLFIGPNRQGTAFLEVLVEVKRGGSLNIFHAMTLRPTTESHLRKKGRK